MTWDMNKKILTSLILFMLSVLSLQAQELDGAYNTPKRSNEEFADYMVNVRNKLQENWNNPELTEEGSVTIQFKLINDGTLCEYDIIKSSGDVVFDEFAINTLKKSLPFEPFPSYVTNNFATIVYTFESIPAGTEHMKELVGMSEKFINVDNEMARKFIDEAIRETDGDCIGYYLYARRYKMDRLLCDSDAAEKDLEECKRLKEIYNRKRIKTYKEALEKDETPFGHFVLANAYDVAGDYNNAIEELDKAIAMTELNNSYKRYRAELVSRIR